jgi:hypothetical protein
MPHGWLIWYFPPGPKEQQKKEIKQQYRFCSYMNQLKRVDSKSFAAEKQK